LDLLSLDQNIDPKAMLRKPVTIEVDMIAGGVRFFHGSCGASRSSAEPTASCRIAPRSFRRSGFPLAVTDCRIFQQKSVPDIVKKVLDGMGSRTIGCPSRAPMRRATTAFSTASPISTSFRALPGRRNFYFFEHTKDKHTMVFADAPATIKAGPVASSA
jgi:type VI secretion system secreted protein VgrG